MIIFIFVASNKIRLTIICYVSSFFWIRNIGLIVGIWQRVCLLPHCEQIFQTFQLGQNGRVKGSFLLLGQCVVSRAGSFYIFFDLAVVSVQRGLISLLIAFILWLQLDGRRIVCQIVGARQRVNPINNRLHRRSGLLGRLLGIRGVFLDYTFTLVSVWKGATLGLFAWICFGLTVFLFRRGDRLGYTFAFVSVWKGAAFGFVARLCLALAVFVLDRRVNRGNLALARVTIGQSAAFGYAARLGYFRSFCLIRIAWSFYYNRLLLIKDRL